MTEYGIYNNNTNEETIIYGYNFEDACRRANLNPQEWEVIYRVYVD